jgi:hypothetical protein
MDYEETKQVSFDLYFFLLAYLAYLMYSVLNTIIVSHLQTDEKNVLIIKYQLDINSYHRRAENDYNKEKKKQRPRYT